MNRDELYRIWKTEKSEKTLQKLPSSFYSDVERLLSESKAAPVVPGQDRTQKVLSEKEFKILRRLATGVAETRMRKIVDAVLSRQDVATDLLTPEETDFAKQVAVHIGDRYRFIEELGQLGIAPEEKTASEPVEARLEVVRFLSDFPAIIGVDLKTYGPFKAEDLATLPIENASALVSQGVVRQVRFSEGITSAS
jgi:DNA replication factor GINS